jgi:hypothetical protein
MAITVQTPAPKSPPCATNFAYPRRFISTTQAFAVRSGPQPEAVGLPENPNPVAMESPDGRRPMRSRHVPKDGQVDR